GGIGGNVSLHAGNQLAVFAPILANGGSAGALAMLPTGGAGGNVTLVGDAGANIWSTISMSGGDATGFIAGAIGGAGGTFTAGSSAPYSIFGSIVTSGGNASTHDGATLEAGTAGAVNIGVTTPVTTLTLGIGTYSTNGGSGRVGA